MLKALAGTAALILSISLVACGQSEQAAETTEEQVERSEETEIEEYDEIDVPEIVSRSFDAHRDIANTGDTTGAEGFDELATRDSGDVELDATDLTETDGDDTKAPSDLVYLSEGGMQMAIPADWPVTRDESGYVFTNAEHSILGFFSSAKRTQGASYDYEAMVRAIPQHELDLGFTDVQIIDDNPIYTNNGNPCGHEVMFWESYESDEYYHYVAFIESKSHLNIIEFMASPEVFEANCETLNSCVQSLSFLPEQMVA